ncbi:MAG: hypothetical protein ABI137_03935 [Antricoccus sp.]
MTELCLADRASIDRQLRHLLRQGRRDRLEPSGQADALAAPMHRASRTRLLNTLMLQNVLAEDDWAALLTAEDDAASNSAT